jgi:outer membrane protein assembly factor BamB
MKSIDVSPVVFSYKGRDLVAAYVAGGRLALLDSSSLGGPDHHTPLAISSPLSRDAGSGSWGRLATAATSSGTRFVYVSVQGRVAVEAKSTATSSPARDGAIVAFTVTEQQGTPTLTQAWISPNIPNPSPATIVMNAPFQPAIGRAAVIAPAPTTISGGLLFTLAQGSASTHAKLYALDAETGVPLYVSGDELAASAKVASVSASGAHVLFLASDNTLYAYGIEYEKN